MKTVKILFTISLIALMATIVLAKDADNMAENHQRITNKFITILNEQWGVDKDKVSGETYFLRDFGADSLDIIELVMALEDYFDITITDEEWDRITTVNSAVKLIIDKSDTSYYSNRRWQH